MCWIPLLIANKNRLEKVLAPSTLCAPIGMMHMINHVILDKAMFATFR